MSNILVNEFEKLKADLITAYDVKGMRASGKFADSLEVVATKYNVKLIGEDYSQQLETGRKGGTYPNISAIEQWIKDKGISARIEGNISISSLAFLIARKIYNEGWKREGYGGVSLISEVITDERIQKIIDEVGAEQAIVYSSEIIKMINEIAI